jgi:predicted DNA-binding transcriptional regulator YafY
MTLKKTDSTPKKAAKPAAKARPAEKDAPKKPGPKPLAKAGKQEAAVKPKATEKPTKAGTAGKAKPSKKKESASKSVQLPIHAATLFQAISERKVVELLFIDANSHAPRNFEPRSLSFNSLEQAWHVWGWDRRYNADRCHCLDSLAEINLIDGIGRAAQGPYPEDTPPNHIGGWLGGEPISVKVALTKQKAYSVRHAPAPFPAFSITDSGDGGVQISFTATDFRAIARWCMQFGDGIQILEPSRLADKLKQVGTAWGAKPQAAPAPMPLPPAPPKPKGAKKQKPEPEELTEPPMASYAQPVQPLLHEMFEERVQKAKPAPQRPEIRVERL